MKKTLLFTLAAVIVALTLAVCVSADAEIPAKPLTGSYSVKSTAIQLTDGTLEAGKTFETTATAKKAVRIVPTLKSETIDISSKSYIYFWLYVSDDAKLYDNNGDSIELCSGGAQDVEEVACNFYYDKEILPTINGDYEQLKTGWNEYLIRLEDFNIAKGGTFDATRLNFIGLVLRSDPIELTFAISDMYAVNLEDLEYDSTTVTPKPVSTSAQDTEPTTTADEGTTAPSDATTTAENTTKQPEITTKQPETTTKQPETTTASPKDVVTDKPNDETGCGSITLPVVIMAFVTTLGSALVVVKHGR